jgi:hypothetical protein
MTEEDWLACDDPIRLLRILAVGSRKARLFACACCRQAWHCLGDRAERHGVEAAERYADDTAAHGPLARALRNVVKLHRVAGTPGYNANRAVVVACDSGSVFTSVDAVRAVGLVLDVPVPSSGVGVPPRRPILVALVRCVFGNPFRRPRSRPPLGPHAAGLAQAAYD